MTIARSTLLMPAAAALAVLSGCSTVSPNPTIVDAQARLSAAYSDKMTAERGQGDLANARTALGAAQSDWAKGEKETTDHEVAMAATYMDLAETRGRQAQVEQDTVRLKNLAQIAEKNQTIAGQDQQLAAKDRELASKSQQIASKDEELTDARSQLRVYNMKISAIGATMVLDDVSFETGKSDLLPGGVNRMQALINYLRLSPDTQVRIEGFTDNVGSAAYNQALSLARAEAVKATLTGASIDPSRIATVGSGFANPVSTNDTEAGRQSNRRVEITLLKQPGA